MLRTLNRYNVTCQMYSIYLFNKRRCSSSQTEVVLKKQRGIAKSGRVRLPDLSLSSQIPEELQHPGFEKEVHILHKHHVILGGRQTAPQGRRCPGFAR